MSDNNGMVIDIEYILTYAKNSTNSGLSRKEIESEPLDKEDQKGPYRLGRELNKWGSNSRREDRPTMYFPIVGPSGKEVFPIRNDGSEGCWRWGKKKMFQIVDDCDVEFVPRDDGTYIVYEKIRTDDPRSKPYRSMVPINASTADGTKRLKALFDGNKVFDYAKPVELLEHLSEIGCTSDEDIVMDFFAGSSSTADMVITKNLKEDTKYRFVCIKIPEKLSDLDEAKKSGFDTVSGIGIDRIRRIFSKLSDGDRDKVENQDLGLKVLKLTSSHYKPWQNYHGESVEELESLFESYAEPLVENWREIEDGLFTEILLLEGFPLDSTVTEMTEYTANRLRRVTCDYHENRLIVCLDDALSPETVEALNLTDGDTFVCLDTAVDDKTKARLADKGLIKTI